jgi:hypothetical protein
MGTGHAESVLTKAVAYVKDMLGIPPAEKEPDVVAKPEYSDAPAPTTEDAIHPDPYTMKSVAQVSAERREYDGARILPLEMWDERDRALHRQEKDRQAQQQSAGW